MTIESTTHKQILPNSPIGVIREVVNKETKDLYLAAALYCEGARFIEIDKTDRTRMIFKFEGGELADRIERQWYEGVLVVSATDYAAKIRICKSLIHS